MMTNRLAQSVFYSSGLGVVSAASLGLAVLGRPATAARLATGWQSWIGPPAGLPGRFRPAAANALVGLLLGVLALIPLGLVLVFVVRGIGYGWVDPGPYDTAWGGPTLAGAWTVHFLVGAALAAVGLAGLAGIAALHRRWTARLAGRPGGAWVLPVVAVVSVAEAAFFIAWLHQI
ncbi:hypothetical protein BJY16_001248 [Actinoplanes octamycinicus]|uniref:Uncharacterized protein n=1 Tax=Actinoplanes octamycinicus TaxID=135948 RepID=A0A7W7GT15_9ACTN|nr:hypothetical protein [Actinoplanes octamycinicus]MBB4737789.1 hypothetical protein [Actinoplanes octamycinicus]GIE58089.1 hypothetical protein Aoc01nite_34910 [Actinoplanes octamycinicus]